MVWPNTALAEVVLRPGGVSWVRHWVRLAQAVWPGTVLAEGEGVEPSGGDPRRSWHCSTPHDWLEVKESSSFDCTATIEPKWTQVANRYPPLRNHRKSLLRFICFIANCDRNYKIKYNIYKYKIIKIILNKNNKIILIK